MPPAKAAFFVPERKIETMIHRYQLGGLNIVLDICSGSVHVVDEVAYDMIGLYQELEREELLNTLTQRYPRTSRAELEEGYEQIGQLKAAGKLFTPDTFEGLMASVKRLCQFEGKI